MFGLLAAGAALGFVRGLGVSPTSVPLANRVISGPGTEELIRAGLHELGVPVTITAAAFAADHVLAERRAGARSGVGRFADVFAGSLLYARAFQRYGFLGAVVTHAVHNIAVAVARR